MSTMFNATQIKTFQKALAQCDKWEPMIAKLEQMAVYSPAFADRIREMRIRCDNLRMLSTIALAAE